jgi:membrane protein
MRTFLVILRRAFLNSWIDGCFGIAKGAAYSGLLSLFPVISTVATILVQANAERVAEYLARFLFEVVPPGATELLETSVTERGERPLSLIIGAMLLSVWAASSLMATLMEGFRAAYRLPGGRSIVQDRLVAIILVFVSALPAVAASALIVFGGRLEQGFLQLTGLNNGEGAISAGLSFLGRILRFLIAFGAIVLTTSLLYFIAPNRPQKWKNIWPGAFLATTLWLVVTAAFAWYVRNLAGYNVMYGSIAGVIALIVWMYLLAAIALFGCEYNAERERIYKG